MTRPTTRPLPTGLSLVGSVPSRPGGGGGANPAGRGARSPGDPTNTGRSPGDAVEERSVPRVAAVGAVSRRSNQTPAPRTTASPIHAMRRMIDTLAADAGSSQAASTEPGSDVEWPPFQTLLLTSRALSPPPESSRGKRRVCELNGRSPRRRAMERPVRQARSSGPSGRRLKAILSACSHASRGLKRRGGSPPPCSNS